jgi:hypothetical protein
METLLIILYGLYIISVGITGNAAALISNLSQEKSFVSWIVIIAVIASLGNMGDKKLGNAFLFLILVSYVLKNKSQVITNFQATWNYFMSGSSSSQTASNNPQGALQQLQTDLTNLTSSIG